MSCINKKSPEYLRLIELLGNNNTMVSYIMNLRQQENFDPKQEEALINNFKSQLDTDGINEVADNLAYDNTLDDNLENTLQEERNFILNKVAYPEVLMSLYPTHLPNTYYSHNISSYNAISINTQPLKSSSLKIKGRITTDRADALLIDDPNGDLETNFLILGLSDDLSLKDSIKYLEDNIDKTIDFSEPLYVNTSRVLSKELPSEIESQVKDLDIIDYGNIPLINNTLTQSVDNVTGAVATIHAIGSEYDKKLNQLSSTTGASYQIINDTDAEELLKNTGHPYNGESGFVFKGKVYLVQGKFTMNDAIHEFSHIWVNSLYNTNKELIDKLYEEYAKNNPSVIEFVNENYQGFSEEDKLQEVMVRAITDAAQNNTEENKSFLHKILTAIRQFLRKVFGISFSKINENTTIQDLAHTLMSNEKLSLDNTGLSEKDYALFNMSVTKLSKDLTILKDDNLKEFVRRLDASLYVISSNLKTDNGLVLQQTIGIDSEVNWYKILRDKVSKLRDQNIAEDARNVLTLASTLNSIYGYVEAMHTKLIDINTDKSLTSFEKLKQATYFSTNLTLWRDSINELLKSIISDSNYGQVQSLVDFLEKLGSKIKLSLLLADSMNVDGVVDTLWPHVEKGVLKFFESNDESVKKWENKVGQKHYLKNEERTVRNKEEFKELVLGLRGDNSRFSSMWLESPVQNEDPLLQSVGIETLIAYQNAQTQALDYAYKFNTEFDRICKKYGFNRSDISIYKNLLSTRTMTRVNEKGEIVEEPIKVLINQFGDYQRVLVNLDNDIRHPKVDILDTDTPEEKTKKLEDARKQAIIRKNEVLSKYFNSPYKKEYWELQKIWETEEYGAEAYMLRNDLITRLEEFKYTTPFPEDLAEIEHLQKELRNLSKLTDANGNYWPEDSKEYKIAKVIKKYQEKSREIYEYILKEDTFQTAYNNAMIELKAQYAKPEDFELQRDNWLEKNMINTLSEEFYKEQQEISKRLSVVTNEINKILEDNNFLTEPLIDSGAAYKQIFDIVYGLRDDYGQINAFELTEEQLLKIKELEELIYKANEQNISATGLTQQENDELFTRKRMNFSGEEKEKNDKRIEELTAKKELFKTLIDQNLINEWIALKKNRISKDTVYSEQYLEKISERLKQLTNGAITQSIVEEYLQIENVDELLKDADDEFIKWFNDNHIKKTFGDKTKYVPTYPWTYKVPNDSTHIQSTKVIDEFGNQITLQGTPINKYKVRRIRPEIREELSYENGKLDIMGNLLPLTVEQKNAKGITDDPYNLINKEYEKLNAGQKELADFFVKMHLDVQEINGLLAQNKLSYDLPRYPKTGAELFGNFSNIKSKAEALKNTAKEVAKSIRNKERPNISFDIGVGNYETNNVLDTPESKIPMHGLAMWNANEVSDNIPESLLNYAKSAFLNRALTESAPIMNGLRNILENNDPKLMIENSKNAEVNRNVKALFTTVESKRKKAVVALIERYYEGVVNKGSIPLLDKLSSVLMGVSAKTSLSLNIPSAIKNFAMANIQNFIRTIGIKNDIITLQDFFWGQKESAIYVKELAATNFQISNIPLRVQMYEAFSPISLRTFKQISKRSTNSVKNETLNGEWPMVLQETGEVQAQTAFWLGMMRYQKIKLKNGTYITYDKAWELDSNKRIKLRDDVEDREWDRGGKLFNSFCVKLNAYLERSQGNFNIATQTMASQYAIGKLTFFMRRHVVPSILNRFSGERMSGSVEDGIEGYYRTTFRFLSNYFGNGFKANWNLYTDKEKSNIIRTGIEIAIVMLFWTLIRSMGWDPDDKDKYKKLESNSWAYNMALYELMTIKSEAEQFIPLPSMGLDNMMRMKDQPSIAFGTLNKISRVFMDLANMGASSVGISNPSSLRYKHKQGIWDAGTLKIIPHSLQAIGITGTTFSPETGIKNFQNINSRN